MTLAPRAVEGNANNALGRLLRKMMPACQVRVESTGVIVDNPGLQPDILITAPSRAPVVIEAEYMPARDAEREAVERLGLEVADGHRPIEAAIALRYPSDLEYEDEIDVAMPGARLEYAVFYEDESRFPESGWLSGSCKGLAEIARLVSVPERAVEEATNTLVRGIDRAAAYMETVAGARPAVTRRIVRSLKMPDTPQSYRMACAIIANAMVFHDHVADMHDGIRPMHMICGDDTPNPQASVLQEWGRILEINYWSVFAIARDIASRFSPENAAPILRGLQYTAGEVGATRASFTHDMTGRIFQRLIADRKYLASFYTLPASAALLARLAVAKLEGVNWADANAVGGLRVGDFACGTGALLAAVYDQIAVRHENAGGDLAALHPRMMENALYGCDVMPSAIHITSSTLSGMQPDVRFGKTQLYALAYGRQDDDTVSIGSLELLRQSSTMTLFNTSDPAMRTGSAGEETAAQMAANVPDEEFDLVIMNPPFTRNTGQEGAHVGTANRAFAAFDASDADQREMGRRLTTLTRNTVYHGNAGIASAFAALGHHKLKDGGVLALVMPLSVAAGVSWQKLRRLLAERYTDVTVLSIAANGSDISFSSDTGMAECLIVARKSASSQDEVQPIRFVSFGKRPSGFAHSAAIADAIESADSPRTIGDGPFGGTPLMVGDEKVGEMVASSGGSGSDDAWKAVRLADAAVAQTAHALENSKLWLPGESAAANLRTARLGAVGELGLYHIDITGPAPRGPFTRAAASPTATYPALWGHDAANETRIVCAPDSQLIVKQGMEDKAVRQWATATRSHVNRDFRFTSQPLAVAITERVSMGGRSWPNVAFPDARFDYPFALWSNCTLGLLMYWWHSSRQQDGRGLTTVRAAANLVTLDFRALTDEQLDIARSIFDDFRERELQPAYLADADPNRALLDRLVLRDLLGFDDAVYQAVRRLAAKWRSEPSVHGGKARPADAGFVG